MTVRWMGLVAGADDIVAVDIDVDGGTRTVVRDHSYRLPTGERANGYASLLEEIRTHVREGGIAHVIVKGSSKPPKGGGLGMLKAAELRGVALVAARLGGAAVQEITKGTVSRTFGARDVDAYLGDDGWWDSNVEGQSLRKGSREAALLVVQALK